MHTSSPTSIHQLRSKGKAHRSIVIIQPLDLILSLNFSLMADQDCNKINLPLALSSSIPSWWDLHHHATRPMPITSSANKPGASAVNLPWENYTYSNLSPCDQEDVSSLTADESSHLIVEPSFSSNNIIRESATDNSSHLWNQLLLGVGASQELRKDEMGESLINAHSSKSFYGGMFEPSAYGFFANNFDKKSNKNVGYSGDSNLQENNDQQRSFFTLSSSNNVVNSWSIARPDQPQMMHNLVPHPSSNNIPSTDQYLHSDITGDQTCRQYLAYQPQLFDVGPNFILGCANSDFNQMRPENDFCGESVQVGSSPATISFPRALFVDNNEYGSRPVGARRPRESNMISQRGFSPSLIDPFSNAENRLLNMWPSLSDARKPEGTPSNPTINKGNGRASANEGKKKRSDDISQSNSCMKKPRHEGSSSIPSTAKTPKSKVEAEKLSALQQIVSPYGKTDTASVLQEAIGCIKRLQENVQLLSNPYMKSSLTKLQEAWGSLDGKHERRDKNKVVDLKSKGLCLVPISSIPQDIKEDNSGPDFCWPAYRGCFYR